MKSTASGQLTEVCATRPGAAATGQGGCRMAANWSRVTSYLPIQNRLWPGSPNGAAR